MAAAGVCTHAQVGIHIVGVVAVCTVVLGVPVRRRGAVLGGPALRLGLVIHHVKANHLQAVAGSSRQGVVRGR